MNIQVNFWAILVASVANMLVGALWYSPLLFGKLWSRLAHVQMNNSQGASQVPLYVGSYFAGLVLAAILAVVISISSVQTIWEGVILDIMVWIGFTAAPTFANAVFEGRPFGLWGINAGYPFVSTVIMSIIFMVWR